MKSHLRVIEGGAVYRNCEIEVERNSRLRIRLLGPAGELEGGVIIEAHADGWRVSGQRAPDLMTLGSLDLYADQTFKISIFKNE